MRPKAQSLDLADCLAAVCSGSAESMRGELKRVEALLQDAIGRLTRAFGELGNALQGEAVGATEHGVEASVHEAVTALQFEDLVRQHLAHVGRQLADLEAALELLPALARAGASAAGRDANRAREILARLELARHRGPVGQSGMSAGAMELF